jgi:hypothetical protein
MLGLYKIGFVQGPQKLNDESEKVIHHEVSLFNVVHTSNGATTRLQYDKYRGGGDKARQA